MMCGARSYQRICAFMIATILLFPICAAGGDIRVLFVPSEDLAAQVQTRAIEQAIAERGGPLNVVKDLRDAHVLVQFTDYRIEREGKGGPRRWWDGQLKLLVPPDKPTARHEAAQPERFSLLIIGEDGSEMPRAVVALERVLRKALGGQTARRSVQAI